MMLVPLWVFYFGYFEAEGSESSYSQGEDNDADSNSELDIDDSFFEPEWEPPMPLLSDTPDETNDTKAYETNDTEAHHDIHNTRQDIEAHAQGQRGFVAVPYPDPRAGQRISQHSPDHSANVMYGAQLVDDKNDENLYYPFASKIECEVARWAKLRGSSSTAFSDLLSIDGVRIFLCCMSI